jgi:hypothetical protein
MEEITRENRFNELTKQRSDSVGSSVALYFGDPGFHSGPYHRLLIHDAKEVIRKNSKARLTSFIVFLGSSA